MPKLPPAETMYRALAARDPAFDGIFYVAVKTTRSPARYRRGSSVMVS